MGDVERQSVPTHASIVASVGFAHTPASDYPALSRQRCRFLCDWILTAFDAHVFAAPVRWHEAGLFDYPTYVPVPMDIGTSRELITDDEPFDFGAFLVRTRLVWANACRYNSPDHPFHVLARRLARLFDEKVVAMQQADGGDDDRARLTLVYTPLIEALLQHRDATPFVAHVNLTDEPHYAHFVAMPLCLSDVQKRLHDGLYHHRDDVESDLRLIWSNALAYCPREHWIAAAAADLRSLSDRLLQRRRADVDSAYVVGNTQRRQLLDNIVGLDDKERRVVLLKIAELSPDAVADLGDGTSTLCIDSLSLHEFIAADALTRITSVAVERG